MHDCCMGSAAALSTSTSAVLAYPSPPSLSRLALPISVTNLCGFCIGLISLSMTGRLGAFELSACTLGTTLYNVTGTVPCTAARLLLIGFRCARARHWVRMLLGVHVAQYADQELAFDCWCPPDSLACRPLAAHGFCGSHGDALRVRCMQAGATTDNQHCCLACRCMATGWRQEQPCLHPNTLIRMLCTLAAHCRQAYGAGNFRLVGVVFQRAMLLTTIVAAAVALLWTQAETLLLAFRHALCWWAALAAVGLAAAGWTLA